jgi:c-di-GMP-binding flagellar brake protein YcgR
MTASSSNTPLSGKPLASGTQVLMRSRIEIARTLVALCNEKAQLIAVFGTDRHLFVTHIRQIDPVQSVVLVNPCANDQIRQALLAEPFISFSVARGPEQIEFNLGNPVEVKTGDTTVLKFSLPEALVVHQRRKNIRLPVIPAVRLRCIANTGGVFTFDCAVVDVSRDGIGAIVHDNALLLPSGTILKGCEVYDARSVCKVDIEIRYSAPFTLPNGEIGRRAGCRLIADEAQIDMLFKLFVAELVDDGKA